MKRNFFPVGLGIFIAFLLIAGQALAQSTGILTYDVPFAFQAGNVKLPAGQYIVKIPSSPKGLIYIESPVGARHAMLLTMPFTQGKNQGPSKLVFNQYGATYFLSKVWDGLTLSNNGQELMKSKAEKEYMQQSQIPVTFELAQAK